MSLDGGHRVGNRTSTPQIGAWFFSMLCYISLREAGREQEEDVMHVLSITDMLMAFGAQRPYGIPDHGHNACQAAQSSILCTTEYGATARRRLKQQHKKQSQSSTSSMSSS